MLGRRRTGGPFLSDRPAGRRRWNLIGFLACALAMAYALYEQHFGGLEPCHLCIFQRVAMIALGLVFAIALVHDPKRGGGRVYAVLIGICGLVGAAVAMRHVWLQMQPPGSVGACGASLDVMFQMLPPSEVLLKVFKGGAECQKIDWSFLGLSMPAWLIAIFLALGTTGALVNWSRPRSRRY
jgi:protein dithiol:quinone oxidoreductase